MTKRRNPDECLPLTPAMFEVLIALADGDKHGYAVLKEVERRTEARSRSARGRCMRSSGASSATASSPNRTSGRTPRSTMSGAGITG